jgi:DHA1 family putative efflux transporter-like MFS transporter
MKAFKIEASLLASLVTSYSFSASIFSLLCSFFIGRFDKRKLFVGSLLGFILGNIICILSHEDVLFTLGRIISGGFGGIFNIALLFLATTYVDESKRGRILGIIMSAFAVVSTFGVPLGIYISNLMTWEVVFSLLVLITFIVFVFSILLLFSKAFQNKAVYEKRAFRIEFRKEYVLALVLNFFTILGGITITPFVNPYYILGLD